jgi:outer membrane receptor protein involved in Fe transport
MSKRLLVLQCFFGLAAAVMVMVPTLLVAGTTGKIAGRVIDGANNEAIIGANIVVQGTYLGAASNVDGFYTINNIPPGKYRVVVSFMGYRKYTTTDVIVKIDLTTRVDAKLTSEAIQADEIVVRAERPVVQKDLTSSSVTVSSEDLKRIPTENIGQVVNIQAGVVGGHFRGGRADEVAYLIDGVSVTDPFNNQLSLQIDNSSVREMEVISGTFNAEYGKVMSGVVNVVTPEGSQQLHGSLSGYTGDYLTSHTDVFPNNGSMNFRIQDAQGSLSGSIVDELTFFLTGRYYHDGGYFYGPKIYTVNDRSPYQLRDPSGAPVLDAQGNPIYIITATGDSSYVKMNPYTRKSFNGKLAYSIPELKFSYGFFYDDNWNKYYDHAWSWTPDGIMNHYRTNQVHSFQVTHAPSSNTYQTLKLSYNDFDYKGYLYANPYDSAYVDPSQGAPISGYTFQSGGNQADRYDRYSRSWIGQWSLTSQVSVNHKVAAGLEARYHEIYNHNESMINKNTTVVDSTTNALVFEIGYPNLGAPGNQSYLKKPIEWSAFVQDKMEYDMMIINAGIRLDYFNAKSSYPADLRNPGHPGNPLFPKADTTTAATPKVQISPRLGISFPITDQGIIHFSYGHFFQIPDFQYLYYNSDYLVTASSGLSNIIGNPDLEAERRVMYEVGLQQVLFNTLALNFTVYYSDIRNLLGQEIINTYEGFKYARFVNRDYANVRGFMISIDKRFADFWGLRVDYTFQDAEGNASDPMAVYNNNQTDPPIETNKKAVPLDWDQRSTLNVSLTVGKPSDWNVGMIMSYGSGFPYTEDIRVSQGLRFENGGTKPPTFNVDLRAEKTFSYEFMHFTLFALVYNLLDTKNEVNVDAASGRANVDLYTYLAGPIIGLNTIEQYVNNPANYSAPRRVQIGMTVEF